MVSTASVTVLTQKPGGGTSNVLYFPVRKPNSTVAFGRTDIAAQPSIYRTVVADFNNDGSPDIAVAQISSPPAVLILLGRGDGTFDPPLVSSAKIKPYDLVAGDVNQDGNIDLVVTDGASGTATLLGDGQGHFTPFALSQDDSLIYGYFFLADFNGDGALDVFKGGSSDYTHATGFFIALGNGDGSFPQVLSGYGNLDGDNGYPAVGDFDGDGVLDVGFPDGTQVAYFHGNGDGSFEDPVYFQVDVPWPPGSDEGAIAVDINHDGKLDIVTNAVSVLLGNGDGSFTPAGGTSNGLLQSPIFGYADMNGDGYPDISVAIAGTLSATYNDEVQVQLGTADGSFQQPISFLGNYTPAEGRYNVDVADFNNDGQLDIVNRNQSLQSTNGERARVLSIYLQGAAKLNPLALSYGDQKVGTSSQPQTAKLRNISDDPTTISTVKLEEIGPADFTQISHCPKVLPARTTCSIDVAFSPQQTGIREATSVVTVDHGSAARSLVTGTGTTK